jgi:hypothetical protein
MMLPILILLLLVTSTTQAQTYTSAGTLEPDCKAAADGNFKAGAACIMVIDGFVNGYMAGAKRGGAPPSSKISRTSQQRRELMTLRGGFFTSTLLLNAFRS